MGLFCKEESNVEEAFTLIKKISRFSKRESPCIKERNFEDFKLDFSSGTLQSAHYWTLSMILV